MFDNFSHTREKDKIESFILNRNASTSVQAGVFNKLLFILQYNPIIDISIAQCMVPFIIDSTLTLKIDYDLNDNKN
jgi:hypothetical protein